MRLNKNRLLILILPLLSACGVGLKLGETTTLELTLSGVPSSYEQAVDLSLSGSGIVSYSYDFFPNAAVSDTCGTTINSTTEVSIHTAITETDLGLPGPKLLCIVGHSLAGSTAVKQIAWTYKLPSMAATGLQRFTTTAPLVQAETANTDFRHAFCENMPNNFGNGAGILAGRQPSVFPYNGDIYISMISRRQSSFDPGWTQNFVRWDGTSVSASWVDAVPATAGTFDTFNERGHYTISSPRIGHLASAFYAEGLNNRLVGQIVSYYNWSTYVGYPVLSDSLMNFNSKMGRTNQQNAFGFSAAGTFMNGGTSPRSMIQKDGVFYLYNESTNASSVYSVSVSTATYSEAGIDYSTLRTPTSATVDGSNTFNAWTATAPTSAVATGYRSPYVAKYTYSEGSAYYLVVYSTTNNRWELFSGPSPTQFDTAHPVSLDLAARAPGVSDWDTTYFDADGHGQPVVVGAAVAGSTLNIFFIAGDLDYPSAPPLNCARGVGVYRVNLEKN